MKTTNQALLPYYGVNVSTQTGTNNFGLEHAVLNEKQKEENFALRNYKEIS
jgi:hypothetical protein